MKKNMICIACPMGCNMEVETIVNGKTTYNITGNKCPRGQQYAVTEMTNPTRMVTSTVKIQSGSLNRLPIKTNKPIPKDKIFECMEILNNIVVEAPVEKGAVIIENILGLDVDITATRSLN